MATAKHKFQKLVFNPANQKLVDFLDELQRLAKNAFGIAAHAITEQFIYTKKPPRLKKTINQARLKMTLVNSVTDLETELNLNGFETPDELQVKAKSHNTTNTNNDRPKSTGHYCKKQEHYRNQCALLERQKIQSEGTQVNHGNKNSGANNSIPNNNTNENKNNNNYKNSNRAERQPKTVYPSCETYGKTNHSTEICYNGANAANRPPIRQRRPERQS